MPVERLWQWLRQQLTALHCHRDEDELRDRIFSFQAQLNDEPSSVHGRLRPKTRLDSAEENFGSELGRGYLREKRSWSG